ncbi:MAG TPA: VWA domain-containing protein [Pyrinomonadaceae bacterium]|nr:VWA domain-containing protein [Pyrinomonadaceae bacterium]
MRKALALLLSSSLLCAAATAQTAAPQRPQQPQQQDDEEVVRITSDLVQTDVVVTDKNDRVVPDLKLSDFEVYENGRKQDLKFMEYVGVEEGRRTEGARPGKPVPESADVERELTQRDVRRVIAFVVDDLTISIPDIVTVRQVLRDYVDNKMEKGDLVAIVRVVGGKGLLQQFTSDKRLLRRAINSITVQSNPFDAFADQNVAAGISSGDIAMADDAAGDMQNAALANAEVNNQLAASINDETLRMTRGLMTLSTAISVADSLSQIPGRKSLVLFSAGIPILELGSTGGISFSLSQLINRLGDVALRSGVVINTMDPRGLNASRPVANFADTPARSALDAPDPGFGRGASAQEKSIIGETLAGGEEHLSLRTLSGATGGVSVVNTNDFHEGLDRILARSRGYYVLAYTPTEKFDNKFRKLDVKVRRDGVHVYKYSGYIAREATRSGAPRTKQEEILAAARSPLAKSDLDVSSNLSLKLQPPRGAQLGINLLIDPKTLSFTQADGRYHTSFDVVGFVIDELGKTRGGFSETVNANLTPADYQEALKTGLIYSADTQLPPGYFQLRAVVREDSTGSLGTISRYVEVPDLTKGRLALSSIFLHSVDPDGTSPPTPMTAMRRLARNQDLRYSVIIYNAKFDGDKPLLRSQTIITRDGKVVYRGAEQPVVQRGNDPSQVITVDQIGLGKAPAGRYVLTLIVTDLQADKKTQPLTRSIDFDLVE